MLTSYLFISIGIVICAYSLATVVLPGTSRSLTRFLPDRSVDADRGLEKVTSANGRFVANVSCLGRFKGLLLLVPGMVAIVFGLSQNPGNSTTRTSWQIYQSQWITQVGVSREKYEDRFASNVQHVYVFFYAKVSKPGIVNYRWTNNGVLVKEIQHQYNPGYNDVQLEGEKGSLPLGNHKVEIVEMNVGPLAQVEFAVGIQGESP